MSYDVSGQRFVITGAGGGVGSTLVDQLIQGGASQIVRIDPELSPLPMDTRGSDVEVIDVPGDIADADLFEDIPLGGRVVFHLAALKIHDCMSDPDQAVRVNIDGTNNVFKAAAEKRARHLVFASAGAVYGSSPTSKIDEHRPRQPETLYASTKAVGEDLADAYNKRSETKYTALRIFNVYGGRGNKGGEVIDLWMRAIRAGQPPIVHGDGSQQLDFIHVEDVAKGFMAASAKHVPGGRYNLATGIGTSLLSVAKLMLELFGSNLHPVHSAARRALTPTFNVADVSAARDALDFTAVIGLRDGLRKSIEDSEGR